MLGGVLGVLRVLGGVGVLGKLGVLGVLRVMGVLRLSLGLEPCTQLLLGRGGSRETGSVCSSHSTRHQIRGRVMSFQWARKWWTRT